MFFDLLKSRRSIRDFQDTKVEKEKIDAILKSALSIALFTRNKTLGIHCFNR